MLSPEGKVLIDPLPLTDAALAEMGKVAAICLTQGHHQRSAWHYRKLFGVPVYAPAGAGRTIPARFPPNVMPCPA